MAGILGILGRIPFVGGQGSMFSPFEITKKRKNSFAKHQIIQSNNSIEDTGFEPIEIDIQMKFFQPWTLAPSTSINLLESFQDAKIPAPLVLGDSPVGRGILTLFIIEEISSKMEKWVSNTLTVAEVTVKLIEYGNPFNVSGPLGLISNVGAGIIGRMI
jgi:hypothetical protein